jgi:predicted AAA+ superfamily ATPase
MFYNRSISSVIEKATQTFPVVLLTGPRQVGKSTVFEQMKEPERASVSLDDPQLRALAKSDPMFFLQEYKPPVLIDEVQYAPELFPYIKIIVDREKKKGLFWLTGSQPFLLMKGVSESLAGRVAILEMQGFSQAEKFHREPAVFLPDNLSRDNRSPLSTNHLYEIILNGSFPELIANKEMDRDLFFASYIKTYIERDIRMLKQIEDEHRFIQFIKVTAARSGQLLNYSNLAADVDISENTAKSWISLLETSGLIYLLQPYHTNLTKRAIKTPKLYFNDTGLCCYLCGWKTVETLSVGAMNGAIFETYVVTEILKSYWNLGKYAGFYFYRDKEKREIDLLISQDGLLYPVEIKRSANPNFDHVKNFSVLETLGIKAGQGALICFYENLLPLNRDVTIVPVGYLG